MVLSTTFRLVPLHVQYKKVNRDICRPGKETNEKKKRLKIETQLSIKTKFCAK